MTKLTILTPAYKRPIGLAMCQASVQGQHRADTIQHLIVPDEIGKGVGGMYRDLPLVNDQIAGEWVYVLSDDDVLIYPRVVDLIMQVEEDTPDVDVIMVKMLCNGRILPWDVCWHGPPLCGGVTLSNWIARRDVHIAHPFGHRYEGDFDALASMWQASVTIAWADIILAASQSGANQGRPE